MYINEFIKYVGVTDKKVTIFEGLYKVNNGMLYNSYVILDKKIAVMDSVEEEFVDEWLQNLENALEGRSPDYLIVQHMEPDHSAGIFRFMQKYPNAIVASSSKSFVMMNQFFGTEFEDRRKLIQDGESLCLGDCNLTFVAAPMVHWPEVMMTYESKTKTLFAADAFGKFGAEKDAADWADEARRYYIGIVGKYGKQVQNVLKKASTLPIETICSLHGPVLKENLSYYFDLYERWASYQPEKEGVLIAYTSIYGNTEKAAKLLAEKLSERGVPYVLRNLVTDDMSDTVAMAFCFDKLVLATTTYNGVIFPRMEEFIRDLVARNYKNRKVALIENGSWAPVAARVMKEMLKNTENTEIVETVVTIRSALSKDSIAQIDNLADLL